MFEEIQQLVPPNILYYKIGKDIWQAVQEDAVVGLTSLFLNQLIHQHNNLNYRFREHEVGHLFFNGAIEQFQSYEAKEYPNAIQLWLKPFLYC